MKSRGDIEEGEVYTSKKTVTVIAADPTPTVPTIATVHGVGRADGQIQRGDKYVIEGAAPDLTVRTMFAKSSQSFANIGPHISPCELRTLRALDAKKKLGIFGIGVSLTHMEGMTVVTLAKQLEENVSVRMLRWLNAH